MVCLTVSVLGRRVRQTAAPLPTIARGTVVNPTGLEVVRNLPATVIRLPDATRGPQRRARAAAGQRRAGLEKHTAPPRLLRAS